METTNDKFEDRKHDILFGVRRSIRYHAHRRRFFDRLHNTITFMVALFGTATMGTILAKVPHGWSIMTALSVTAASMIDLVIGSTRVARQYDDLVRRFIALEKKIIISKDKTMDAITTFEADRLDIEADEPSALIILNMKCQNEMCRSMGYPDKYQVRIGWWQNKLCQIFDLSPQTIMPKTKA